MPVLKTLKKYERIGKPGLQCKAFWIVYNRNHTTINIHCKILQENISKLVAFYNPSSKDMKALFDEYLGMLTKKKK